MALNVLRNVRTKMENSDIITNENWFDVTKTRYVHAKTNHMFFRVDSKEQIGRIDLKKVVLDAKLVIISDYNKGFLHEDDIDDICNLHNMVFLDTKKILGSWAEEAALVKINDYEYQRSRHNLSHRLHNKIVHTMGGDGCEYAGKRYPVERVEVKDSSGAGDSFMAALAVNFIQTGDTGNIEDAIIYANKCASEVVKHRGVTTI
jgi:sugar/nucleoside kinase (ribokinase family)